MIQPTSPGPHVDLGAHQPRALCDPRAHQPRALYDLTLTSPGPHVLIAWQAHITGEGKAGGALHGARADGTCACTYTADGSVEPLVDEATSSQLKSSEDEARGRKRVRACRQASRGGSESKRRREEARQAKREQWQAAQVVTVTT